MISVMLGGISSAVSAADTISPRLKRSEKPSARSRGCINRPSAATVAGAEPQTEPNAMQAAIEL